METFRNKCKNIPSYSLESPFDDVNNEAVTSAYRLGIVAGTGEGKFTPDKDITRQEAAVMLNNMAKKLELEKTGVGIEKYTDESYFAEWAKDSIYDICKYVSENTPVMTGTGNGKFSPWFNYSREQAIATMNRIYGCEIKKTDITIYKEHTEKAIAETIQITKQLNDAADDIIKSGGISLEKKNEYDKKTSEFEQYLKDDEYIVFVYHHPNSLTAEYDRYMNYNNEALNIIL